MKTKTEKIKITNDKPEYNQWNRINCHGQTIVNKKNTLVSDKKNISIIPEIYY